METPHKSFLVPALVLIIVVLVIMGVVFYAYPAFQTNNFSAVPSVPANPSTTKTPGPTPTQTAPKGVIPYIGSITPSSAKIGSIIDIRGSDLTGFEGDVYFFFERADGKVARLQGTVTSQTTGDAKGAQIAHVPLREPCQKGEVIYGDYSGIAAQCDYVELTSGVYKVYTTPWAVRSNVVSFTITGATSTVYHESPPSPLPYIRTITPPSASLGSTVTVQGNSLGRTLGNIFFYFKRSDGVTFKLTGTMTSLGKQDANWAQTATLTIKDPCMEGSGGCGNLNLTAGTYQVYTMLEDGTKNYPDNVTFTIR